MNEAEFIKKIESLKSIEPNKDWVALTRDDIFEEAPFFVGFNFVRVASAVALTLLFSFFFTHLNRQDVKMVEDDSRENELQVLQLALLELKDAKSEMTQSFSEIAETKPKEEVVKIAKEIAPSLVQIDEKEDVIAQSLGLLIESDDLLPNKDVASFLIFDLENRSLKEEDQLILEEAKEAFDLKDYRTALKKVLEIGE